MDADIKKLSIECSFCGKNRNELEQLIEGPEFNSYKLYICNECIDMSHDILHKEESNVISHSKKKEKILTPEQIKKHLDEYVIGQHSAKEAISVAIYNHYKRINNKTKVEIDKANLILIGPSGSGKTLAVKTVAKLFDLPYIIADATSLTESGYAGEDSTNLITRLIQAADNDIEKAQHGIIFLDEIDKKSRRSESSMISRDVSGEGVQQALLKMMEGTTIDYDSFEGSYQFDTKNVLFIFSGAFVGLDEIIRKSSTPSTFGLASNVVSKSAYIDIAKNIKPSDIIKFGLIPEFVGRCPITVVFDELKVEDMISILKEPKNSIVDQFKALFKYENIDLEFDDKYLQNVSTECIKQKVGARGLRTIIERDLQNTQYILPRLAKEGVRKILIDSNGAVKTIHKEKKRVKSI